MKLTHESKDLTLWTVTDPDSGFKITFREGLFNDSQQVTPPDSIPDGVEPAVWAASAMRAIGDHLATEHRNIALCDTEARRRALWTLANEKYWVTMAAATNSLNIELDKDNYYADMLLAEVEDYFRLDGENPAGMDEAEIENLLGSIYMLDDDEAHEVFIILAAFWKEHYEAHDDIERWARDLLWWPAWLRKLNKEPWL